VLHGQSNIHPLLALLSILGGVQTLGPIGLLVGPMSVVFLQTLIRILHREYKAFERRVEASPPAATAAEGGVDPEELADSEG
jgi:predicted PurR-regulated permease PerM